MIVLKAYICNCRHWSAKEFSDCHPSLVKILHHVVRQSIGPKARIAKLGAFAACICGSYGNFLRKDTLGSRDRLDRKPTGSKDFIRTSSLLCMLVFASDAGKDPVDIFFSFSQLTNWYLHWFNHRQTSFYRLRISHLQQVQHGCYFSYSKPSDRNVSYPYYNAWQSPMTPDQVFQ